MEGCRSSKRLRPNAASRRWNDDSGKINQKALLGLLWFTEKRCGCAHVSIALCIRSDLEKNPNFSNHDQEVDETTNQHQEVKKTHGLSIGFRAQNWIWGIGRYGKMTKLYRKAGTTQAVAIYQADDKEKMILIPVNRSYNQPKKPIYYLKRGIKNQCSQL